MILALNSTPTSGGVLQYRARKEVCVGGLTLVLYGRLDALLAGGIYDIKFSKGYDRGKFSRKSLVTVMVICCSP